MNSEKMICYDISTLTWVLILIFVGTYGAFKNFKTRQLYKEKTKIVKIVIKPPSPIPSSSFSPSHTSSPSPSLSSKSSWHPSYSSNGSSCSPSPSPTPSPSFSPSHTPSPTPSLSSNSSWHPSYSLDCSKSSSSSNFDSDLDSDFGF